MVLFVNLKLFNAVEFLMNNYSIYVWMSITKRICWKRSKIGKKSIILDIFTLGNNI